MGCDHPAPGVVYSRFVGAKGSLPPACSQAIYVSFSIQRPIQYFQIEALQSIKYSRILAGGCQWLAYGFARS